MNPTFLVAWGRMNRVYSLFHQRCTRFLLVLLLLCGSVVSTLASPLSVTAYNATTPQSPVRQGAKQVTFYLTSYSGVIGNATFSNQSATLQILATQDGDRLNAISYTVTGGTLIIVDVR